MKNHYLSLMVSVFVLGSDCDDLHAQIPRRPPPTAHECHVAANKASSDPRSAAFRWAMAYGRLAECGSIGAPAVASALRRADAIQDTLLLGSVFFKASHLRHPEVLEAALEVAGSRESRIPVRVIALDVLLLQHDVTSSLYHKLEDLAKDPSGRFCGPDYVSHNAYLSETPLPADYRERIVRVTNRIASDPTEPAVLRGMAACIARYVVREDEA